MSWMVPPIPLSSWKERGAHLVFTGENWRHRHTVNDEDQVGALLGSVRCGPVFDEVAASCGLFTGEKLGANWSRR